MAEAIAEDYLHDGGRKGGGRWVGDRFHHGKGAHAAACDEVSTGAFKTLLSASLITFDVKDQHWSFDWEVIH